MSARSFPLGGDLALVSLPDLARLLGLNRASGCLVVRRGGGEGRLWFEQGRVVNAADEADREGEDAALRVLAWRTGRFEFRPGRPQAARRILRDTEALIREAVGPADDDAREEEATGGASVPCQADPRQEMSASHAEPPGVARETIPASGVSVVTIAEAPVDSLVHPGDRLVLRPGHPVRLRVGGAWLEASDATLGAAEFAEFKVRLLGAAAGDDATQPGIHRVLATVPGGRVLEVTRVSNGGQEVLWLRPVALAAPDPARIEGPLERLLETIETEPGVTLFGGPDPETASRLLHAVVARLLPHHDAALLLASDDLSYRHAEGAGVVVETSIEQLTHALAVVLPETLVIDDGGFLPAGSLAHVDSLKRVLARVVTPDAERALACWRSRLEAPDRRRLEAMFGPAPRSLALAEPVAAEEERIPFTLRRYEGETRNAARPAPARIRPPARSGERPRKIASA